MAERLREFPPGFLLGCASAAHQVEGGLRNDWTRFEREPGRIRDGSVSGIACDWRHRWSADLEELARRGQNAHRFSIEWSRVEPLEGQFDEDELRWYRDVADRCLELGMTPVVTLLHFTLPLWLASRGGLLAPEASERFARFAAACARVMGTRVTWWVTINEPAVHATMGYLLAEFPPAHRSFRETLQALAALARMHAAAAVAIRAGAAAAGATPKVGIAHHERRFLPSRPAHLGDRLVTAVPDHLFNRWFLDACRSGRLGPPVGAGRTVPGLAGSLDYVGVNYYCEELASFSRRSGQTLFAELRPDPSLPRSAYDWAIDAGGLHRALRALWERYRLPLLVLENGVADVDDALRSAYLVDHLGAVLDAVADGVDVRAYLHWTALDNFEWAQGYGQQFGLFGVDRATLERRPKPSADVFAEICLTRRLPA